MNKERGERRLRRVLLATDRSAASRAALLAVAGFAVGGQMDVLVVHVDDGGQPESGCAFVDGVAQRLLALAVNAHPELREARPVDVGREIARAADAYGADLVVVGSRSGSALCGLLGSVGRDVLSRVRCPVLLARAGRRSETRRQRVLVIIVGDEDPGPVADITAAIAEPQASALVLDVLTGSAAAGGTAEPLVLALRRRGLRARGRVRTGTPDQAEQLAAAARYGADVIVIGSRRLLEVTAPQRRRAVLRLGPASQ